MRVLDLHRIFPIGALACAGILGAADLAATADEAQGAPATDARGDRGYVVFSHSTLERLGSQHVPSRNAVVKKVSCALARDEFESLQIGVHALGADLGGVRLIVESDLDVVVYHGGQGAVDEGGGMIRPTAQTGVAGEPPEVVLHPGGDVRRLLEGRTVNFWLTFHASPRTPAAMHHGQIRVEVEGRPVTVLDLEVRVRPFVLHRPRISIGIYYPQGRGWVSDAWWMAVCRDMAEHGQTAVTLYDYEPWWRGAADGTGLLRYLRVAEPTGLVHSDIPWIWLYGGGWDATVDGKKITGVEARVRAAAWARGACDDGGFPEMVFYGWDEPHYPWPALREQFRPWRDVPMRISNAMSASATYGHGDVHDVWIVHCPVVTSQMRAEAARMGAQLWMYSCAIRSWELLRERYLAGIFTWSHRLLGSYLWAGPAYTQHWWLPGGDRPLPMAGWETRREGVDDYRYLQMLEDCIADDPDRMLAVEAAGWLETIRRRYTMNPHAVVPGTPLALDAYDTIRERAASYIERLGAVDERSLEAPPPTFLKDEATAFRERSLEQCIAGLSDADSWQRRSAAWALFERGPKAAPAVAALTARLDEPEVRMVALRALEAIGPDAHTGRARRDQAARPRRCVHPAGGGARARCRRRVHGRRDRARPGVAPGPRADGAGGG